MLWQKNTLNLFKGKVVTVFTYYSRMMDQNVTDIFSHVLQLDTRQRRVISYHTQASLLSEKRNQSCNRCDWFLDTVNCLRLKNSPCFSEWICLYLKEKGDREPPGGGLYHSVTGISDRNQLFLMGHPNQVLPLPLKMETDPFFKMLLVF